MQQSHLSCSISAFLHAYIHCWHAAASIASPAGEPLYAWCGPQPNSRLLLNYGIVDESNPYDKLPLTVTLPANDPLYKVKRGILQVSGSGNWVQVGADEGVGGHTARRRILCVQLHIDLCDQLYVHWGVCASNCLHRMLPAVLL
jgi:hypothetical protein